MKVRNSEFGIRNWGFGSLLVFAIIFSGCTGLIGINGRSEITSVESHIYPRLHRERRIELSGVSFWALKHIGALFIKREEPELANAVKGLKEVRVAQYSAESLDEKERKKIINLYTHKLMKKGWENTVKVLDGNEAVSVLTSIKGEKIRLFVVNIDQSEMTVVKLTCHKDALENLEKMIYAKIGYNEQNLLSFNVR